MKDIIIKKVIDKARKIEFNQKDNSYDIFSAERISLLPGDKIELKVFIDIEIPDGYIGLIFPRRDLYIKYNILVLPEIIENKIKNLHLIVKNDTIPKVAFMMSDKEKIFGSKNKYDIFIGDKIAKLVLIKGENFNIKEIYD